jgi:hypothetical protein
MGLIIEIQAIGDQLLQFDVGGAVVRTPSTAAGTAAFAPVTSIAPIATAIVGTMVASRTIASGGSASTFSSASGATWFAAAFSWRTRRTILAAGRTLAFGLRSVGLGLWLRVLGLGRFCFDRLSLNRLHCRSYGLSRFNRRFGFLFSVLNFVFHAISSSKLGGYYKRSLADARGSEVPSPPITSPILALHDRRAAT